MGLFGFLRRGDVDAIPKPGTPEFEAAMRGTAIPDSQSVSMGEAGWASTSSGAQVERATETLDLRGSGRREEVEKVLREHGIDPDRKGQTIDASEVPGLREALIRVLLQPPNTDGFPGGISNRKRDPGR
jgi:hypothetical protein